MCIDSCPEIVFGAPPTDTTQTLPAGVSPSLDMDYDYLALALGKNNKLVAGPDDFTLSLNANLPGSGRARGDKPRCSITE